MGRYFRDVVFLPSLTAGATDATTMRSSATPACGAAPLWAPPEDVARGVHGTDERISLRAYARHSGADPFDGRCRRASLTFQKPPEAEVCRS